jgi:hypothetical protein
MLCKKSSHKSIFFFLILSVVMTVFALPIIQMTEALHTSA